MNFVKTFAIAIVSFIVLNVIFFLISYGIGENLEGFFDSLEDSPSNILIMLFGPIYFIPATLIIPNSAGPELILQMIILTEDPEIELIIALIGYIVAPLIAAFLSGYFGDDKKEKLGGWFLAILLTAIITAIWVAIEIEDLGATSEYIANFVGFTIGYGFIIGIFYGFFTLIVPERG
jgi:hypothetical protein